MLMLKLLSFVGPHTGDIGDLGFYALLMLPFFLLKLLILVLLFIAAIRMLFGSNSLHAEKFVLIVLIISVIARFSELLFISFNMPSTWISLDRKLAMAIGILVTCRALWILEPKFKCPTPH